MSGFSEGGLARVVSTDHADDPAIGCVLQVLAVDASDDTVQLDWRGGWWMDAAAVEPVAGAPRVSTGGALLVLLGDGWTVAAAMSSVDGSAVLAFAHKDYTMAVEVGGGTVDFVGAPEPNSFDARTLRAFADLADEGEGQS
jgi:hypothetical protein